MKSSRGQLWSLDAVLAGVLFTLALGLILSQTELHVFSSQQERNSRQLQEMAFFAGDALVSKSELFVTATSPVGTENIRCGPNFQSNGATLISKGWSYDNDLSWMENCLIDRDATLTPSALGIPPGYSIQISSSAAPALLLKTSALPSNIPYSSLTRKMIVFPAHVGAVDFRKCLDGDCASFLRDVTITVWRS